MIFEVQHADCPYRWFIITSKLNKRVALLEINEVG